MSTSESLAEWKLFLETKPPNTSVKIQGLVTRGERRGERWHFTNPQIQLHCEYDGGPRRFDPTVDSVYDGIVYLSSYPRNYEFITYQCRDCQTIYKTFAVLVIQSKDSADVVAMKLGEYPPFSAPISSRIQKLLSKSDLELYRKGSRAEAQGLGIGAATYFRRIVEKQWKLLVTEIRKAAERLGVEDLRLYDAAIQEKQFSKAVGMLTDAIPDKLLILNGENPLTLLYQPLSKQLHGLTDEECLQQAADIRVVLTALLENIADVLKAQDELHEAVTRLKDVRSKPTDHASSGSATGTAVKRSRPG